MENQLIEIGAYRVTVVIPDVAGKVVKDILDESGDKKMGLQFEYPHPLARFDWEKELALLRASITQMEAGEQGRSVEDVFAEIDRELTVDELR
ncbi:MAG TPA: hypothetical protein VG122_09145 [Gemmata sp.]|nr:hypothetical protein [Gemmata sp.]